MSAPDPAHTAAAMMQAAAREWRVCAPDDWTLIDFWRWPRGFYRSAWVAAGYIGWNPLDALDRPTPAGRAVNALLTQQCLVLAVAMTARVSAPAIQTSRFWLGSMPSSTSTSTTLPPPSKPSAMSLGTCPSRADGPPGDSSTCGKRRHRCVRRDAIRPRQADLNGRGQSAQPRGHENYPVPVVTLRGRPPRLPFSREAAVLALLRTRPPDAPRRAAIQFLDPSKPSSSAGT